LYQQLEEASASFVNETRRRAEYEMSALLELFDVEAEARLAARLDEALAKARVSCGEMEQGVKERTEQNSEAVLVKLSGSAVKDLQGKTEAILEAFRAELQSTLKTLTSEAVSETSEQLRKTAGKLADDLQSRADKAYGALSAQLTAAGKAVMTETEKQIAALSQAALANLGQQAEAVHRKTSEFVVRDLRKRLDQVGNALQQLEAGALSAEPPERTG
jgi:hypothetical protein